MAEPAYRRLHVDERRRQLLELGADLFASHSFAELSMARIAREAGISKALLYHYFPTKQDFFVATLQQAAQEVQRRTEPDPELPAAEAVDRHGLCAAAVEHRVGEVPLSEPSVIVAASAPHRGEAFAGAREIIDRVKAEAPIWKKEIEGEKERWVEGSRPGLRP